MEKTEGYQPVATKLDSSNGLLLSARIGQYVIDKTARGSKYSLDNSIEPNSTRAVSPKLKANFFHKRISSQSLADSIIQTGEVSVAPYYSVIEKHKT